MGGAESIEVYGVEIWADTVWIKKYRKCIVRMQRRGFSAGFRQPNGLRTYCTSSCQPHTYRRISPWDVLPQEKHAVDKWEAANICEDQHNRGVSIQNGKVDGSRSKREVDSSSDCTVGILDYFYLHYLTQFLMSEKIWSWISITLYPKTWWEKCSEARRNSRQYGMSAVNRSGPYT